MSTVAIEGIEPPQQGYEPSALAVMLYRHLFALRVGLEPTILGLTGRSYIPLKLPQNISILWPQLGSNQRLSRYERGTLTN